MKVHSVATCSRLRMKGVSSQLPVRTGIAEAVRDKSFVWLTGIEDTFIGEPHARSGRILDEYALTDHYDRWYEDLGLMRSLGVKAARYGLPWYRICGAPGKWDWEFADKTLERLLDLGIEPVVDLVHYGTPLWMESGFLNADYPKRVAEFAHAVADRFKGRIRWYTPFNEPRVCAYYCGKLGLWPPHAKGWSGFLKVLVQICKGIVLSDGALRSVDPEIVHCHVDATDLYVPLDAEAAPTATLRQDLVFLALDLICGRFKPGHSLYAWAIRHGFQEEDAEWFQNSGATPDVVGINLYPMFSKKTVATEGRRVRIRMPYSGGGGTVETLAQMYWDRYSIPLMVTETASSGSFQKRLSWLDASVNACSALRERGVPVLGYTWWPMFSLVSWSYLASERELEKHLVHMGLWDLDASLNRRHTPLVDRYACLASGGPRGAHVS